MDIKPDYYSYVKPSSESHMKKIIPSLFLLCISMANPAYATIVYNEGYVEEQAENGNHYFQFLLAQRYQYALDGYPKNYQLAFKWYLKAAEQGDISAQYHLADMYLYGEDVPRDYSLAMHWYKIAAEKNSYYAQSKLGLLYQYGLGVPQDDTAGANWYKKAADQNYPLAQYYLGQMYIDGRGVEQDYKTAYALFVKAATSRYGLINAQYALGLMYAKGLGTAKNLCTAHDLFEVAALQGYKPAQQLLTNMQYPPCPASGKYDVLLRLPANTP